MIEVDKKDRMTFKDIDGEYVAAFDDKGTTVRGIVHDGVMHTSTGPNLKCEDLQLVQRPIKRSYRDFIDDMTKCAQRLEDVARYIESGLDQCGNFGRFILDKDFLRAMFVGEVGDEYIYWFDEDNDEIRFDRHDDDVPVDIGEYILVHVPADMLFSTTMRNVLKGVNVGFSFERREVFDGVEVGDVLVMTTGMEFRAKVPTPKVTEDQKISMGDGVFLYSDCVESVVRFGERNPEVPTAQGIYKGADGLIYLIMRDSFTGEDVTRILRRLGESKWEIQHAMGNRLPEGNAPYTRIEV